MELVLFSALDGLPMAVEGFRDLDVIVPSRLDQALRLLSGPRVPDAIYLDDTRGVALPDLWRAVSTAQEAGARVLLNMSGSARNILDDARSAGVAVLTERDPAAVAAWIGLQLGLHRGATTRNTPIIAIGAAKGGIGKTFATCVLAEGLRRRGLNVLVWDSDISNPGLVPAFRVPSSAPSYLHLIQRGPSHWNPTGIQPFIYAPEHTRSANNWGAINFLIGSHTVARAENDVRLPDWQSFYQGVTTLDTYDLVLIDTPPDYLRRPYATHVLQAGGTVILPTPPGARERMGVGHMLDHFREHAPERLEHCALLFMEPERGVTVTVNDVAGLFGRRYPQVSALGVLPRAPKLASLADEHDGYISMIDIGPHSAFTQAVHRITDALCTRVGITPRLPIPRSGPIARALAHMRGERAYTLTTASMA